MFKRSFSIIVSFLVASILMLPAPSAFAGTFYPTASADSSLLDTGTLLVPNNDLDDDAITGDDNETITDGTATNTDGTTDDDEILTDDSTTATDDGTTTDDSATTNTDGTTDDDEAIADDDISTDDDAMNDELTIDSTANNDGDNNDAVSASENTLSSLVGTRFDTPLPAGRYIIRPEISLSRVLDVTYASKSDGANIWLYSSNMTLAQRFDVSFDDATGLYTFMNINSGKVLDVQWAIAASGTQVWQYTANKTAAQQWVVVADPVSPGAYTVISALSLNPATGTLRSQRLVLDIKWAIDADGSQVQIYAANGTAAQSFHFMPETPIASPGNIEIADGFYTITSRLPKRQVLDIQWASEATGTPLQLYPSNKTLAQLFYIKKESDGFYTIRAAHSGGALGILGDNLVAGTMIQQFAASSAASQRWAIVENADKTVSFISKATGMALDVRWASDTSGALLWQWEPNSTAAQCFSLTAEPSNVLAEGYVKISPWKQPTKNVDIANASRASGANIQAFRSNDTFSQVFEVKRIEADIYALQSVHSGCYITAKSGNVCQETGVDGQPKDTQQWKAQLIFGGYQFVNVATGEAMVLTTGGMDGHDIRLSSTPDATNASQAFRVEKTTLLLPRGFYTINNYNNFFLDKTGGQILNGTAIQVYTNNNTNAQKWYIEPAWGDYVVIKCAQSGRALEIRNGLTTNGTAVQLYDYQSKNSQVWKLIPAGDGWFYLQSANGTYLAANPGTISGDKVTITTGTLSNAHKFRFETTTFSGLTGTYAEVNLTTQTMIFVKNGVVLISCDVVTGAPWSATPAGTFKILKKQVSTVLIGPGYASPVDFWMPFTTTGCGFHDASWQPWFGGDRWTYAGSHGCVNMPYWAARELYSLIQVGDTVWIHY